MLLSGTRPLYRNPLGNDGLLFDLGEPQEYSPGQATENFSRLCLPYAHWTTSSVSNLLRLMLNREKALRIFGPPGFLSHMSGEALGYTWNLTAEYPFSIEAVEVHPDRMLTRTFQCQERFAPGELQEKIFSGFCTRIRRFKSWPLIWIISFPAWLLPCRSVFISMCIRTTGPNGASRRPMASGTKGAIWRGGEG